MNNNNKAGEPYLNLCTTVPFTVSNTKKVYNKYLALKLLNISLLPNISKHCAKNQGRKNKRTRHGTCSQRVIFLFKKKQYRQESEKGEPSPLFFNITLKVLTKVIRCNNKIKRKTLERRKSHHYLQ